MRKAGALSKRLAAVLVVAALMAVGMSGVVSAHGQGSNNPYPDDPILSGLWAGVNATDASGDSGGWVDTDTNSSGWFDAPGSNDSSGNSGVSPSSPSQGSSDSSSLDATNSPYYVALGDSVAAGLGLGAYDGGASGGSAVGDDTQCGRSNAAYAYQVAADQGLQIAHVACRGAKAGDLFTRQGVRGPNIAPQLNAAFTNGTPQLITITAGANDVHWDEFLRYCYATRDCGGTAETALAEGYESFLRLKLQYLFADIQSRSGGQPPRTVITGYYNPLSTQCLNGQRGITSSELSWLNSRLSQLNDALRDAANQYDFVTYVPVSFEGHDICSSDPWVQGLNDPAPFHPTAEGQSAIANAITAAL